MTHSPSLRVAGSLWSVPSDDHRSVTQHLRSAGLEILHWDMTDGHFAPRGGFTAEYARAVSASTGMRAEAHLMVEHPLDHVDQWTDFCDLVAVHAEAKDWWRAVERIEARGARAAVAVRLDTRLDRVLGLDIPVLAMSIAPGHASTPFNREALGTVRAARSASDARLVGLDGGLTAGIADEVTSAGANWLVSGTDLFSDGGADRWRSLLSSSRAHDRPVAKEAVDQAVSGSAVG